jgi:hypothetical protein
MAENKDLTIYQKLFYLFGPNKGSLKTPPKYNFNDKELLSFQSKEDYNTQKLELQQQGYLEAQWARVDSELYQKAVYYETSRIASYMDYEAMEFSIIGDTKIATPDGFITIKELADKGRDYEFITYAYDHNLKQVVPAKARNAHYTRDEMTYKITFDDDSFIVATYGHRFLKRDGIFVKVEELKEGDSMMPFYRKSFYNNQKYNWVYTCNSKLGSGKNGWVPEHDIIAEWFYRPKNENEEVHHKDFNGKNNNPENLVIMDRGEHRAYHARLNNEKLWANPEYRAKMIEVSRNNVGKFHWDGKRAGVNNPSYIKLPFELIVETARKYKTIELTAKNLKVSIHKIQNELKFNGFKNWMDFLNVYKIEKYNPSSVENRKNLNFNLIPWDLIVETAKKCNTIQKTAETLDITTGKLMKSIQRGGFKNWTIFTEAYGITKGEVGRKKLAEETNVINHKIKSIEPYGIMPVYDLTVPGYKNFATDTIFSHNTPEISAALDIYSEETTTPSEQGYILTIHSDSKRVKSVLQDLFYNILDIQTNLPMWTRNVCKYGDNFVFLKIDNKRGIIGSSQLTNIEIERKEEGLFPTKPEGNLNQEPNKTKQVTFRWREKAMDFNPWEIAHFRLLGDDRRLPYGTSMLEKARRIWKQLLLSEDAMLVYRVVRAPERRVFKIYVGNIDDKDVDAYVQKVANKFKRQQLVDQKTGQVDLRYNTLAVDQDYFVPVRDPNAPNPIDTLAGASNLGDIADIEYIQKKLLTALRVPKAFLGFEEAVGEGKTLSLLDIRFARTINKIQQSMIQELNKIAIIHLYILGLTDDLNNFSLNLTNPSTQGEMLKIEQWKEKVTLYKDLVSQIDAGFAPTSHMWAKKNIFHWTDEEIKVDDERQRLERAATKELEGTSEVIKNSGLFTRVDKIYGEIKSTPTAAAGGTEPGGAEAETGGGFGGGDLGGGFGGGETGGFGGEAEPAGDLGGGEAAGGEAAGTETGFGEGFRNQSKNIIDKLLMEGISKNEDIMMMTEGIKKLIGESDEDLNEDDELLLNS